MNATMSGSHAVAILPTGVGKSMVFEIPLVVRGALTIAIVPFRTIAAQILQDANLRGIRAEHWRVYYHSRDHPKQAYCDGSGNSHYRCIP